MKRKIGLTIFTVLPIFVAVVETRSSIVHFLRESWPAHAMFHVFMGLGALLACYGLILFLTWGPLRRGERWSWFAIAYTVILVYGGQLLGDIITKGGLRNVDPVSGSGTILFGGIIVALCLYVVGLSFTFPHIKRI